MKSHYVSKRAPREKQAEALTWLRPREASAALLMDMRTGKTKVVADDAGQLMTEGIMDDLLIIAPGGVYAQWANELMKDWPDSLVSRTKFFTWISDLQGSECYEESLSDFLVCSGDGFRVFCVNAEALSSVGAARDACKRFLSEGMSRSMVVVDESVIIGNKDSTLTKFLVGYQKNGEWREGLSCWTTRRRILSGLASPRSPLQLWSQFKFLGDAIPENFMQFRDRYCNIMHLCKLPLKIIERRYEHVFQLRALPGKTEAFLHQSCRAIWPSEDPTNVPRHMLEYTLRESPHMLKRQDMVEAIFRAGRWIQAAPILDKEKPFKNLEELEERIRPWSFRVRLEDCYDLPESDYSFRDVALTSEQRRIYDEMRDLMTSELNDEGDYVTATTVIAQIVRLHQVLCGHTRDDDTGAEHTIPELRTQALLDLLADYEGKFIVWCSYDHDVRKVSEAIEREVGPVARFWGGNIKTREMEEQGFRLNPGVRGIVGTPDAGGRGRDWSVADLVIYYSNRNDLDKRSQSEMRAKAVGKTRPVAYVDLRVPGTVEDGILQALRRKIDLASIIQADGWRKWLI